MWKYRGEQRPDFADEPGEGQESVWDYPRPPALANCRQTVEVRAGDLLIARTIRAKRVLETASPPTVYIPPEDVDLSLLEPASGHSFCEWKGEAQYWRLKSAGPQAIGWNYPNPTQSFAPIANWLSFYPARVECYLDAERVRPQEGGFYGGWVSDSIVGPWKGPPGTGHW